MLVTFRPKSAADMTWIYTLHSNKLQQTVNGNRRIGYNLRSWNCRKGLIQECNEDTDTFIDLKTLV